MEVIRTISRHSVALSPNLPCSCGKGSCVAEEISLNLIVSLSVKPDHLRHFRTISRLSLFSSHLLPPGTDGGAMAVTIACFLFPLLLLAPVQASSKYSFRVHGRRASLSLKKPNLFSSSMISFSWLFQEGTSFRFMPLGRWRHLIITQTNCCYCPLACILKSANWNSSLPVLESELPGFRKMGRKARGTYRLCLLRSVEKWDSRPEEEEGSFMPSDISMVNGIS